jgi:hypothetical protein
MKTITHLFLSVTLVAFFSLHGRAQSIDTTQAIAIIDSGHSNFSYQWGHMFDNLPLHKVQTGYLIDRGINFIDVTQHTGAT